MLFLILAVTITVVLAAGGKTGLDALSPCPTLQLQSNETFTTVFRVPEGCTRQECRLFAGIKQEESDGNLVLFVLEGNTAGWIAVGFSPTPSMYTADVLGCQIFTSGRIRIIDTWNSNSMKVNLLNEAQNDLCYYSAEYTNERLKCIFSRAIKGSSTRYDFDLNNYYHLLLGSGDTPAPDSFTGGFSYHEKTPVVSKQLINPISGHILPSNISSKSSPVSKIENMNTEVEMKTNNCPRQNDNIEMYRLTQRIPQGCVPPVCDFFLGISNNKQNSSFIDITLEARANGWVAVGFSKTQNMLSADVFGCTVYSDGHVAAIDTWNPSTTKTNVLDNDQMGLCQQAVEFRDGVIQCKFSRVIKGTDTAQDVDLNSQYFILLGTGETPQEKSYGGFTYHEKTPTVSSTKINPTTDTDLSMELSKIEDKNSCPNLSESESELGGYRISLGLPEGCEESNSTCHYVLGINTNVEDDRYLDFFLEGEDKGWVAVGFTKSFNMFSANVLGCIVYSDGSVSVIDTWNPSSTKTNVLVYTQRAICEQSTMFVDGKISCKFSRRIEGLSNGQDLHLNNTYYLLFGTGNTPQATKTGGFTYHEKTPLITSHQINPAEHEDDEVFLETANVETINQQINQCQSNVGKTTGFRLTKGFPMGCEWATGECTYFLGIDTDENNNILITLEGKANGWVAVGFSKTPNMLTSDVLGCVVYNDGSVTAIDTWCPKSHKTNILDSDQEDITQHVAQIKDGRLCCVFSRSIKGTSKGQDLDLNSTYYLLFGSGNIPQSSKGNGGFTFHQQTPIISDKQVNPVEDSGLPSSELVTVESSKQCLTFDSNSSHSPDYRISLGLPKGCNHSRNKCDYFVGINTNKENDNFLDFTLEGNTNGWVAIGFSRTPSMVNSDVIGCNRYGNGTLLAIDTWNPQTPMVNILDEPQTDICTHYVKFENGRITCKFSRAIKGDTPGRDVDLNSKYYLMFGNGETAQANSGGFTYHQNTPIVSTQTINVVEKNSTLLVSHVISNTASKELIKTHGILMIIAWPVFTGLAIYFPAFTKTVLNIKGEWFQLHRGFILSSMVLSVISFIVIFVAHIDQPVPGLVNLQNPPSLIHFILGVLVTALPFVNVIVSFFRCKPSESHRPIYNIVHGKIIGYMAITIALANIALGIYIFESGPFQAFSLFVIVSIIGILMFCTHHILHNVLPKILNNAKEEKENLLIQDEEQSENVNKTMKDEGYRLNIGLLLQVQIVVVLVNIAVCVFIAIA